MLVIYFRIFFHKVFFSLQIKSKQVITKVLHVYLYTCDIFLQKTCLCYLMPDFQRRKRNLTSRVGTSIWLFVKPWGSSHPPIFSGTCRTALFRSDTTVLEALEQRQFHFRSWYALLNQYSVVTVEYEN